MSRYLNGHTIINNRHVDELRNVLVDIYDARSFDLRGNRNLFFANVAYFPFGSSSLSYGGYSIPMHIEFRDNDYLRLQFCIAGSGKTSVAHRSAAVDPTAIVCSPADAALEFGPSFEQLALRVDQAALERDLVSLLGARPKNRISFDLAVNNNDGQSKRLRELIFHTVYSIDASNEPIPSSLLREIDQVIRLSVLYGIPNNFSGLLIADQKTSAPWQVKRIEEWIDAHWRESITVEKLGEVSGASVRSIFATFRNARGYTPMAYLKKVRLNAAREMLLRADPGVSVTGIAFACNFMNSGHFARDYHLEFGERPSETLRHSKKNPS